MENWIRKSYGDLPSREEFHNQWELTETGNTCSFGNDERVGTTDLTEDELWEEILVAHEENTDASLSWISCVLYVFQIEWI